MNKLNKIEETGIWRTIIEWSHMINNMESILYTKSEVQHEDAKDMQRPKDLFLASPTLVLSRSVLTSELEEGLKTDYFGDKLDEDVPELTLFLDAFFRIKQYASFKKELMDKDPSAILRDYVAYAYYDCMSGGMPKYEVAICRALIKDDRINKDEEVYPCSKEENNGRDWYNLSDFMKHTDCYSNEWDNVVNILLRKYKMLDC